MTRQARWRGIQTVKKQGEFKHIKEAMAHGKLTAVFNVSSFFMTSKMLFSAETIIVSGL